MTAQGNEAELEVDWTGAFKEFGEQGSDHETNDQSEEDIMGDHPSVGRQARQATVEGHDRNFDQARCHPEDHDANESKLEESEVVSISCSQ